MKWEDVPSEALELVRLATPAAVAFRKAALNLPRVRAHALFLPEGGHLWVGLDKVASDADVVAWYNGLKTAGFRNVGIAPLDCAPDHPHRAWGEAPWVWVKRAVDPAVSLGGKLLNVLPSDFNRLYGGPSPLAAALAGGLLGAGVGYAGGTIAEQFLPPDFEPGRLRRNATLAGAAVGAAPGALWGSASHKAHPETPGLRAWLSGWPFRDKDLPTGSPVKRACDRLLVHLEKAAWYGDGPGADQPAGQGLDGLATLPSIPRDAFGRVVWQDPYTPPPIRAAAVGLVNAASAANGYSPWVSPWDVASVAAAGATRGLIVGKTLGALAGLRPEAQQQLQRAGVWGNMLTAVVPNAFPGPGLFMN